MNKYFACFIFLATLSPLTKTMQKRETFTKEEHTLSKNEDGSFVSKDEKLRITSEPPNLTLIYKGENGQVTTIHESIIENKKEKPAQKFTYQLSINKGKDFYKINAVAHKQSETTDSYKGFVFTFKNEKDGTEGTFTGGNKLPCTTIIKQNGKRIWGHFSNEYHALQTISVFGKMFALEYGKN